MSSFRCPRGIVLMIVGSVAALDDGGTHITLRNSFQKNSIENCMHLTTSHPYRMRDFLRRRTRRVGGRIVVPPASRVYQERIPATTPALPGPAGEAAAGTRGEKAKPTRYR